MQNDNQKPINNPTSQTTLKLESKQVGKPIYSLEQLNDAETIVYGRFNNVAVVLYSITDYGTVDCTTFEKKFITVDFLRTNPQWLTREAAEIWLSQSQS